jgi:hypothetical protein
VPIFTTAPIGFLRLFEIALTRRGIDHHFLGSNELLVGKTTLELIPGLLIVNFIQDFLVHASNLVLVILLELIGAITPTKNHLQILIEVSVHEAHPPLASSYVLYFF